MVGAGRSEIGILINDGRHAITGSGEFRGETAEGELDFVGIFASSASDWFDGFDPCRSQIVVERLANVIQIGEQRAHGVLRFAVSLVDGIEIFCNFVFACLAAFADDIIIHSGKLLVPFFEISGALFGNAVFRTIIATGVSRECVDRFAEAFELWFEVHFGLVDEVIEGAHGDFEGAALALDVGGGILKADRGGVALAIGC